MSLDHDPHFETERRDLYDRWRHSLLYGEFEEAVELGRELLSRGESLQSLQVFGEQISENIPPELIDEAEGITENDVRAGIRYKVEIALGIRSPSSPLERVRYYTLATELDRALSKWITFYLLLEHFPDLALDRYSESMGSEKEIKSAHVQHVIEHLSEVSEDLFTFHRMTREEVSSQLNFLREWLRTLEAASHN